MGRLLMFKNIDDIAVKGVECHTAEYQILTDAQIIGGITYGPYLLRPWEFGDKKAGEERWALIRVTEKAFSANEDAMARASEKGDYHGGGIPSELVTIAALFLRRRVRLGALVRLDDSPIYFSKVPGYVDRDLVKGQSNFAELEPWLELVKGLNPEHQFPFVLAAKFYQQALELIENKTDLAYLLLVSAVEVLSRGFQIAPPPLSEIDEGIAHAVRRVSDRALRDELERRIRERERLTKRKFVAFIVSHTDESFWQAEGRPQHGRVEPDQLPELMERVYDQRSRTLHRGEPFPPNIFHPPGMDGEMPLGLAMAVGEKKWEQKDFIPNPFFFERLVNHILKNFLKRNQVALTK